MSEWTNRMCDASTIFGKNNYPFLFCLVFLHCDVTHVE
jgi:hypothetical protein